MLQNLSLRYCSPECIDAIQIIICILTFAILRKVKRSSENKNVVQYYGKVRSRGMRSNAY